MSRSKQLLLTTLIIIIVAYFIVNKLPSNFYLMCLGGLTLFSWIVALFILMSDADESKRILWILIVISLPFWGVLFYLLFDTRNTAYLKHYGNTDLSKSETNGNFRSEIAMEYFGDITKKLLL